MSTYYKVSLVLKTNDSHPRKWLSETISEVLEDGEDLFDVEIVETEYNEAE